MAATSVGLSRYKELTLRLDDVRETGKKLGEGSYSEVVEVVFHGTACAAKRIHVVWDQQLGGKPEEFMRVCEIWSQLRHPNVVQLLGLLPQPYSGSATNLPTIVMEKMDCSLRHFVEAHSRESVPLAVKVDILHQVAQGLAYLHGQRPSVVHRELSPNNILINLGSMTAKLSDFGVAHVFSQASRGALFPGFLHFMPPETLPQVFATERENEDRIDVFSLGCIIICVVTHLWPKPLPPIRQTKQGKQVALTEVERRQLYLNRFDPQEKACLFGVVHQCLERDPLNRPRSAKLVEVMREIKDTHPMKAHDTDLHQVLNTLRKQAVGGSQGKDQTTDDPGANAKKVELQKADAAWKRTSEVSMEQTEEEKETQECLEPLEGLFHPGAIGLVRKTGGDAIGPMSGGFSRDPREDRHPGREKRSYSRSGGGAVMRKPSQQPKVIDVPTHEKVELRKADVAWKRASEVSMEQTEEEKEAQDLYRKFQGILNKLTPQKFQKLAEQAKELMSTAATTQERMSGCIEKLYNQAVQQPLYSVAYAKLSLVLAGYKIKVGVNEDGTPKMKSFRVLLLTRCQEEFEKDKEDDEELDKLKQAMKDAPTDEERKQRKEMFEEAEFKARHRSLGNVRLIGELFKLKLLSEAIMHECIIRLLRSSLDEKSLECFAKLMSTIGKEMDHDKGKNLMEKYFNRVSHVIEERKIDSRVRFILQDLVDLRQNAWVPRRLAATNVPTTIDKIHEQAKKEEMEMQKRIARGSGDRSRGMDEWSSTEHSRAPAPSTRIDAERFSQVLNRAAGPTQPTPRLGPPVWGKSQAARAHSPSKYDAQKYQGRNSKGKRDSKSSSDPPPPAGPQRSSLQSSDANAKRSILEAVAKQTGSKLMEQAPRTETVVSDALSDEEVERKSKTIVGELSSNGDYKEAQLCVSELCSPGKLHLFVYTVLNHTMEKTSKDRQVAGVLLNQLLREGVLPLQAFMKGLNDVLEFAEDYECDIPKFWDYIAELLTPSVAHKGFPLVHLKQAHEGPLESGKIGKLVAKILHRCISLEGVTEDQVYGVWSQSGLEWSTHLHVPPEDLGYLLEDHKLTFLTQRPPARQSSSSSGQGQTGRGDPKDWSHVLEEQLGTSQITNDDVFKFMESKHAAEYRSPLFIFSLSSALTRAVVRGKGDSAVFSEDLFRKRCEVLKKCVEGVPELQLQVIYGIQVVLSQKQHPKDVMCNMFNQLYDDDVVSDDTFYHWEVSGREDLEGRDVALVVAKNFLQWLRSAGEEEGEGTVQ